MEKLNFFNHFFSKQCTTTSSNSTVPVSTEFETLERFSFLEYSVDDIVKVIRSLDQSKAGGHYNIYFKSQYRNHYTLFLETVIKLSSSSKYGKRKANIIHVDKTSDKQLITNDRL